ncbi:elongator complex protein 5-like [Acanthaster planci]|uniref:Elongator complex protein 5 n=1 Tax=Acanthaster planci TaxID=133434 RepID=A0A8B7YC26_ACAPL|nr:elongator complex protein 5-like [Acanthaster planci]
MASLLHQIVHGSESSSLIVIQDSVDISGRPLLRCFTNQVSDRVDQVHVFLFDCSPTVFLSGFDPAVRSKVVCHDGWSDPLEWNGISLSEDHNVIHFSALTEFKSHIENHMTKGIQSVAVVIDSLSPVIINKSVTFVCKGLHQLIQSTDWEGPDISEVVCLLHQDVHDVATTSAVCHSATTVLYLEPYKSIAPIQQEPMAMCDLVHRRKSGKVIRMREGLSVDHDYRLFVFPDKTMANIQVEIEPQPDPTANLTFNLTLKDSERKAKDSVVLPYTKVQQRHGHPVKIGSSEQSGKIFYEPDEADDFDDEDPDDDLDI